MNEFDDLPVIDLCEFDTKLVEGRSYRSVGSKNQEDFNRLLGELVEVEAGDIAFQMKALPPPRDDHGLWEGECRGRVQAGQIVVRTFLTVYRTHQKQETYSGVFIVQPEDFKSLCDHFNEVVAEYGIHLGEVIRDMGGKN